MGDTGFLLLLGGVLAVTFAVLRIMTVIGNRRRARGPGSDTAPNRKPRGRRADVKAAKTGLHRTRRDKPAAPPVRRSEPSPSRASMPATDGPVPPRDGFPPLTGAGRPELAPEGDIVAPSARPLPGPSVQPGRPPQLRVVQGTKAAADAASKPAADRPAPEIVDADSARYWVQPVFFGTDRAPQSPGSAHFGHDIGEALTLGRIDVTVPRDAPRLNEIARPREEILTQIVLRRDDGDPDRHFTLRDAQVLSTDAVLTQAGTRAAQARTYAGTALVYLHGFNMGFAEATVRTAQLAHDLGFDGPAFAFSWASDDARLDYEGDLSRARLASDRLDAFLALVQSVPGVERVHLIAHSMGCATLAHLLDRVGAQPATDSAARPIDQLVLAVPDMTQEDLQNAAPRLAAAARGVTLYACATDRALLASRTIRNDFARAGDVPPGGPLVVPQIDTVDITALGSELFALNHNIHVNGRAVLDDLAQLFLTGIRPPDRRLDRHSPATVDSGVYWRLL